MPVIPFGAEPTAHVDTFCRDQLPPIELWPDLLYDSDDVQYPGRLNCAIELLTKTSERLGADRPCLIGLDGNDLTYGEVDRMSNQVANLLVDEYGLQPGNRVLLRSTNKPWLVIAWYAVLKAGCVVVTTVPMLRSGEITPIDRIGQLNLSMCDESLLEDLQASSMSSRPILIAGGAYDFIEQARKLSENFAAVDTAADDVAMLAFTSGTSGVPKCTMHFHRDVLAIADTFSRNILKPLPDDVFIGTPPLAFTFGLGGLVIFPMRVGASTLMVPKATPAELAELIGTHRVTICFTAPTAYRAMVAEGSVGNLRTLRRAVSAGEHLPRSTWHAFEKAAGVKLIDGIGATEMLHVFISAADDDIIPGSTGKPVPGYRAKILANDGSEAPRGEPGRLAVQGPTGCRYLADERQQTYVQDGWNLTGDTFTQDEAGYFWYQSRSDDMIISSGYNIAGPEVEEALAGHSDVTECAVIGTPDESRGMLVHAFIVLAPGVDDSPAKVKELQDFVKATIAPYKYPRAITFIDQLPKSNTGKTQRFRLRAPTAKD